VAAMIRRNWAVQPEIIVVEPEAAPCLRDSAAKGEMVTVQGPISIQGRLDCKAPSMLAFEILRKAADRYVTVSDGAAQAAADLSAEIGIASTPSGAAGFAAYLADCADLATPPETPLIILSEGVEAQ